MDVRQAIEPDDGVECESAVSRAHGNVRGHHFVREQTAVAIGVEGEDGPLARRGEVEFVVRGLPWYRDKGLETGVAPRPV